MSWTSVLWQGFIVTIKLSAIVTAISLPLALLLATASICPARALRVFASAWVDIFRSVPSLALLIFLYYGLGTTTISALWLAAIGLTLIESAYLSEIYRAALKEIRAGQWEAGLSLGLSWVTILRLVVIPEAAVSAIPGTVNMVTIIIKDTSLAALVAVNEVTLHANELAAETFRPLPIYLLLALYYIALILPLTVLAGALERYLAHRLRLTPRADYRALMKIGRTPLSKRIWPRIGVEKT